MGSNLEYEKLVKERNKIIDNILENIKSWDEEIESGIDLVDNNRIEIDKIKKINIEIDSINIYKLHDDQYREKLNLLYMKQKEFFKTLELRQRQLINEKEQLNKKNQVKENYISKKQESIFIDKDIP